MPDLLHVIRNRIIPHFSVQKCPETGEVMGGFLLAYFRPQFFATAAPIFSTMPEWLALIVRLAASGSPTQDKVLTELADQATDEFRFMERFDAFLAAVVDDPRVPDVHPALFSIFACATVLASAMGDDGQQWEDLFRGIPRLAEGAEAFRAAENELLISCIHKVIEEAPPADVKALTDKYGFTNIPLGRALYETAAVDDDDDDEPDIEIEMDDDEPDDDDTPTPAPPTHLN